MSIKLNSFQIRCCYFFTFVVLVGLMFGGAHKVHAANYVTSCGPVPLSATTGQTVVWKALVYDNGVLQGTSSFFYAWSGSINDFSTSLPRARDFWFFNTAYGSVGTKNVTVTVSDSAGWSDTVSCSINITQANNQPYEALFPITGNGTVSGAGAIFTNAAVGGASIPVGSSFTFLATPVAGETFLGWSGPDCSGVGSSCTISVSSAMSGQKGTNTARFSTITTTPPATISTAFTIGESVQTISLANVRQTPATTGSLVTTENQGSKGTVAGGPTWANGYWWWQVNFTDGINGWTIENNLAAYIPPPPPPPSSFTVSVTVSGTGVGTVSGAAINCGTICSTTVSGGSSITLIATAVSGSIFSGWSGGCSGTGTCTVSSNASITATFVASPTVNPPVGSAPSCVTTSNKCDYATCLNNCASPKICSSQTDMVGTYYVCANAGGAQTPGGGTSTPPTPGGILDGVGGGIIGTGGNGTSGGGQGVVVTPGICQQDSVFAWVPGDRIVPCGYGTNSDGTAACPCNFNGMVQLAKNIIDVLIYFSILIAIAMFAFAGYKYLTAAGDTGKMREARSIFMNVAIGFIFVLSAWLIVTLVLQGLVDKSNTGLVGSTGVLTKLFGNIF